MSLIILQIAVKDAIPFQEFAQNPFTVLCTTSFGGHLSWFETSGGRWFAKPVRHVEGAKKMPTLTDGLKVAKFLNSMAREVTSLSLPKTSEQAGTMANTSLGNEGHLFQPMRRKLQIIPYQ